MLSVTSNTNNEKKIIMLNYLKLIKPPILFSSLLSFSICYILADTSGFHSINTFTLAFFGIAFSAAGAAALNHSQEKPYDIKMERTKHRPIASGKITQKTGYIFSFTLIIIGNTLLFITTNLLTTLLSLLTVCLYNACYTPLKRHSIYNTYLGSLPGALPALCGWTASGESLSNPAAWSLFLIMICWQMPHFFAIDWIYKEQYKKAGFKMLSSKDPSGKQSGYQSIAFSSLLIGLTLLPYHFKQLSFQLTLINISLAGLYLLTCIYFASLKTQKSAKICFRTSLIYLNILFLTLLIYNLN
ncbi:MAG: heme o synthase [bacterium]